MLRINPTDRISWNGMINHPFLKIQHLPTYEGLTNVLKDIMYSQLIQEKYFCYNNYYSEINELVEYNEVEINYV